MSNILVTGGTGFIGFNLVNRLLSDGHTVLFTGKSNEQTPKKGLCVGYGFDKLFNDIDILFHQAAISDTTCYDEKLMYQINVWDSLKLFENVRKMGCKQIVYASSCAVYGNIVPPFKENDEVNPLNVYGKSKYLLDQEAMQWGKDNSVNIVGLRYSNVYGSFESHKGKNACVLTQIGNQMKEGKNPKLFKFGEQSRDFVYVKDVVDFNLAAAKCIGQYVLNCGSGVPTTFNSVVDVFNEHFNSELQPDYIDNPYEDKYQSKTLCCMKRSEEVLGISPQWGIKEAIEDYYVTKKSN